MPKHCQKRRSSRFHERLICPNCDIASWTIQEASGFAVLCRSYYRADFRQLGEQGKREVSLRDPPQTFDGK
jgi:hypothetical protein